MSRGGEAELGASDLKIGLLGYGYWGPNLARNFHALPGVELRYICDSRPDALRKAAEACPGARTVSEWNEVLGDTSVEAVVLASPAATHQQLAIEAMRSGRHVFVEKPLALDVAGGEEMLRVSRESGRVLMVGHVFIYHPAVRFIKEYIDAGSAGDIYYAHSRRLNLGRLRRDENCLWSLAPHDVAIMLYLFGERPLSVSARGASFLPHNLEDVVFFTMEFPGGRVGNVHVSWLDPQKVRTFTVVCSERMLVFDEMSAGGKVKIFDKKVYPATAGEVMEYGEELRLHFGEEEVPDITMEEPLRVECEAFRDACTTGPPPPTDAQEGLEVLRVLEAAGRSMADGGRPVEIGG